MGRRVFISKNASEVGILNDYLISKGDSLIAHSFLHFSQIEFDPEALGLEKEYDVIFFGSPRAVFFFKARIEIPETVKIACVGSKTADILNVISREAAFIGKGDIITIADEFKDWCGDKTVLFPASSISLKTVSSKFSEDQKIEMETYSTEIIGSTIEKCDVYVFTSPSNVKGFLDKNSFPSDSEIIAWGKSTEEALESAGIKADLVLVNSSLEELIAYL